VNFWQSIDAASSSKRPFGGDSIDKPEHARRILEHTLGAKNTVVLVADDPQHPLIATISGHVFEKPAVNFPCVGVIYGLWVDEAYRNQGVGQALLRELEMALKAKGAQSCQVGWDSSNRLAERWWQKRGYCSYEVIASRILE
jgi:ribosomal protein S18 acetylase RimI-like enzyme